MTLRLTLAAALVVALTTFVALRREPHVRLDRPVPVPFELANHHIVVPVSVNGSRPLSFVFDTGAKPAIIDRSLADALRLALGREIPAGGVGSTPIRGAFVNDARFTLAPLPGFSQPITLALPLQSMAPRIGHEFDGILGADFISQFVVEVDYAHGRLVLHDRDRFTYSGPGVSVPLTFNHQGHPVIDAQVTPRTAALDARFVVDLGAGGALTLHSPFVAEHGLPGDAPTVPLVGTAGAAGDSSGARGRVRALRIGPYTLTDVPTVFSSDTAGAFANTSEQGNIGARIMERFRVFLDYSRSRMILEPVGAVDRPYREATAGCVIQADGPTYHLFHVIALLDHSPASEAGLQAGDEIVAIDGTPADTLTLSQLLDMFEQPVTRHLQIRRRDARLALTLTPRVLV